MKLGLFPYSALGSLLILSLSVVSAFNFDSIIRDFQQSIIQRSLPGSLALAPEGAVGYQPPPGPITSEPTLAAAPDTPGATAASTSDTGGLVYGSDRALAATEDTIESDEPQQRLQHIPSVSEMDAMIRKSQTASASRDVVRSLSSLVASVVLSLLHL